MRRTTQRFKKVKNSGSPEAIITRKEKWRSSDSKTIEDINEEDEPNETPSNSSYHRKTQNSQRKTQTKKMIGVGDLLQKSDPANRTGLGSKDFETFRTLVEERRRIDLMRWSPRIQRRSGAEFKGYRKLRKLVPDSYRPVPKDQVRKIPLRFSSQIARRKAEEAREGELQKKGFLEAVKMCEEGDNTFEDAHNSSRYMFSNTYRTFNEQRFPGLPKLSNSNQTSFIDPSWSSHNNSQILESEMMDYIDSVYDYRNLSASGADSTLNISYEQYKQVTRKKDVPNLFTAKGSELTQYFNNFGKRSSSGEQIAGKGEGLSRSKASQAEVGEQKGKKEELGGDELGTHYKFDRNRSEVISQDGVDYYVNEQGAAAKNG